MVNIASLVDKALRSAGIPIDGVSIGDPTNRATWVIAFQPAATAPQRTTAATILAGVAVDAAAQAMADQQDAQAVIDTIPIATKAIVLALIDQLNVIRAALPAPLNPITPAQALAAIRNKAGTL